MDGRGYPEYWVEYLEHLAESNEDFKKMLVLEEMAMEHKWNNQSTLQKIILTILGRFPDSDWWHQQIVDKNDKFAPNSTPTIEDYFNFVATNLDELK